MFIFQINKHRVCLVLLMKRSLHQSTAVLQPYQVSVISVTEFLCVAPNEKVCCQIPTNIKNRKYFILRVSLVVLAYLKIPP